MLAETCRARRELLQEVIMYNIHSLQETELFVCVSASLPHSSTSLSLCDHQTIQRNRSRFYRQGFFSDQIFHLLPQLLPVLNICTSQVSNTTKHCFQCLCYLSRRECVGINLWKDK